ncbi:MAG: hypothetical protein M1536_07775, partial [Firmicutes bacterium]|nr:hypothetical protein [Bacillota bacterium]
VINDHRLKGGGLLDSVDRQTEIFVPPLALLQDTLISIVPLTSQGRPAPPKGWCYLSKAYDFLPRGTHFTLPVTIRILFRKKSSDDSQAGLYAYNYINREWLPVEGAVINDDTAISSSITHFTVYAVLGKHKK